MTQPTQAQIGGLQLTEKYTDQDLDDMIELCAQVAENFVGEWDTKKKAIAAAIRKLKDK